MGAERLEAKTVLWAACVTSSPLGRTLGAPLDRAGRVQVAPDLSLPGHPEVFIAGDLAAIAGVPGIPPAAKQMGHHAAKNVLRLLQGGATQNFRHRHYGQLAPIRPNAAAPRVRNPDFSAHPARLLCPPAPLHPPPPS